MIFRAVRARSYLALVILLDVAANGTALAQAGDLRLAYAGYLGDAHLLDLAITVRSPGEHAGAYRVDVAVSLAPGLGRLMAFDMSGTARGIAGPQSVQPADYRSLTRWSGREERISLTYRPGGRVEVVSEPPSVESEAAVDGRLGHGTLDPLSAVLAMVRRTEREGRCGGHFAVFDGVRRYDLALAHAGPATVARYRFSTYAGRATECSIRPTLLSGFPPEAVQAGLYPAAAQVWLAPVAEEMPPVPVRVSARSGLGLARLELVGVEPLP